MALIRTETRPWSGELEDLTSFLWLVGARLSHHPVPEVSPLTGAPGGEGDAAPSPSEVRALESLTLLKQPRVSPEAEAQFLAHLGGGWDALDLPETLVHRSLFQIYADRPNLDAFLARFDQFHTLPGGEGYWIIDGEGVFGLKGPDGIQIEVSLSPGDCLYIPGHLERYFYPTALRRVKAIAHREEDGGWAPAYADTEMRVPR